MRQGGYVVRWLGALRNIYGAQLGNAYRISAMRTSARSLLNFFSTLITRQYRDPPKETS